RLIATSTLVGHNLDFDVNVLRRYGVWVSASIRDTLIAARLLGLGKEKDHAENPWRCDELLDEEAINTNVDIDIDDDDDGPLYNPADNSLDAVIDRYLGIQIPKTIAKLGNSDWSVQKITEFQREYVRWGCRAPSRTLGTPGD